MKCHCITEINEKLREKGFKLSDKFQMFRVTEHLGLRFALCFPIERLDGQRLKREDPKTMEISHCPFCGEKIREEE